MVPTLATRGISIRVGIHTGECEKRGEEWSGMAVHTGARIGALAGTGEVFVSRTMRDLSAGSCLIFEDLGITRPRRAAGNGGILGDGGDAVSQARVEAPISH